LISGKDWKHVLMQKVVTLNTCCDIACLAFQLPHITTVLFRATNANPQLALFRAPTFEGMQQTFTQMKNLCISQVGVVTFSGVVAKWVTVCFLLR